MRDVTIVASTVAGVNSLRLHFFTLLQELNPGSLRSWNKHTTTRDPSDRNPQLDKQLPINPVPSLDTFSFPGNKSPSPSSHTPTTIDITAPTQYLAVPIS